MKLIRKIMNNKKGLTLMELIVGLLMFSIIAVAVSMSLAPTLFAYMSANDFAEYNALLDNLANNITSELSQATSVETFNNNVWMINNADVNDLLFLEFETNSRVVRFAVRNGVLRQEGLAREPDGLGGFTSVPRYFDVFSSDFYKNKEVAFRLTADDPTAPTSFTLSVRLTSTAPIASTGQGFEIERDYTIRPLMLNQG